MTKKKPLYELMYFDPVYTAAVRLIGYGGIGPMEFFDEAKKLDGYDATRFRTAMLDLTRSDRREASPPRYELNGEALRWCYQILGPSPAQEDAFYRFADGSPAPRPEAKEGNREEPRTKPKAARPKAAKDKKRPAIQKEPKGKRKAKA